MKGVLCTQVLYWIHWGTQFFWCFDKTPSANSCPAPPTSWNVMCPTEGLGVIAGGDTQALQFLVHHSAGFLSSQMLCSFSCHFSKHMCVNERKLFHTRTGHICSGRNLKEDARCLFPTCPALAKHSSHSLAGTCGLQGCSRVCWNDPPNSSIKPMWFGESSKYGA